MSCTGKPLPLMFVGKDFDHTVIGNFQKKKWLALSQLIGKPETISLFFSTADLKALISQLTPLPKLSALKLYFASYTPTGVTELDAIVNAGFRDQLTLIFVPMDDTMTDIQQYFIISPMGGVINIPKAAAAAMAASYRQNKVPLLTAIIKDAGIPGFVESNAIWYELEKINGPKGLLNELDCQGAAGLTAFFGSYDENHVTAKGDAVGWAMTLILEFAKTISVGGKQFTYHFDLEDTPDFGSRQSVTPSGSAVVAGFDTGSVSGISGAGETMPEIPGSAAVAAIAHKPAIPIVATINGVDTGNPCPPALGCTNSI